MPTPFVIRTPAATVTDLGTEFGVEVLDNRETHTHVFRGSVVVRTQGVASRASEVVLCEGESASVNLQGTVSHHSGVRSQSHGRHE